MNPIHLSPVEWQMLVYVWRHGPSTPDAIYDAIALVDPARPRHSFFQTITILDALCYAGYLDFQEEDETYAPIIIRAVANRWYYRWPRQIIWWISGLFNFDWLSRRQHMLGFNEDLSGLPYSTSPSRSQAYRIRLAHPRLLSKRYTSSFKVYIYFSGARQKVAAQIKAEFGKQKSTEHDYPSQLRRGDVVDVKLFCPAIDFSDPVVKKLDRSSNLISFLGMPKQACHPGKHHVMLVICDHETGYERQSESFPIQIVDFAFDHVSRPLLANWSTAILSFGSLLMYILTLVGRIDTALGLTSGTTAAALAGAVYARFALLYKSVSIANRPGD